MTFISQHIRKDFTFRGISAVTDDQKNIIMRISGK